MLSTPAAPTLETPRLRLRGWSAGDIDPYARMLADPGTARFITRTGQPYSRPQTWAEMSFLVGHWQLRGYGMFVVEERSTGSFVGRVGPLQPEGWPGFEIAWAIAAEARGNGYATEAAAAAIEWAFDQLAINRIISVIHPDNEPSQRVAERVGEQRTQDQFAPFGEPCDIWEIRRSKDG